MPGNTIKKSYLILVFFIAGVLSFSFFVSSVSALTISKSGDRFLLDGQAKFLLLVSYFDAMDAANLDSDLDYIKSKNFDGIRIFPNWWDAESRPLRASTTTLMDSSGSFRNGQLNRLRDVVSTANSKGLIVDISFARETVPNLSTSNYKEAIEAVARELQNFPNIFYDFQNEANCNNFSQSDADDLRRRVKGVDGNSIVSTSLACEISPSEAISFSNGSGMDIVNFHESRSGSWWDRELTITNQLRASGKPVYLGEPGKRRDNSGPSAANFITAASGAKSGGAAAWTFHTEAGFHLDDTSFSSRLDNVERDIVNRLYNLLQSINWGGGGTTGGATGPQGSCPAGYVELGEANATTSDPAATDNYFCDDDPPVQISGLVYPVTGDLYCSNTEPGSAFIVSDQYGGCNNRPNIRTGWTFTNGRPFFNGNPVPLIGENRCTSDQPVSVTVTSDRIAIGAWVNDPGGKSGYFCVRGTSVQPTPPEPTGPPTITGISPQTAAVGENVEIYGTNLVESVRLENLAGGAFFMVAASVNSDLTIAVFEVPDLAGGTYRVSVSGPRGSTESPQNLTIRVGGDPFGRPIQPGIPTEGLPGFGQLIAMIFTWSLNILGIVVFVMIFFAGFKWFTAAGNTAKVNEARGQITNAVTGAIILLAAWIILYTINPDLVGGVFTLPGVEKTNTNNE